MNPTYKLTPDDRADIRLMLQLREGSKYPQRWTDTAIAAAYGVSRKTIYKIKNGLLT